MILKDYLPVEYQWIIQNGKHDLEYSAKINPWYFIKENEIFDFNLGKQTNTKLIAFVRRDDTDDFCCYKIDEKQQGFVLVHNWTPNRFDEIKSYKTIWDWIKNVIDDIEDIYLSSQDL